MKKLEQVPFADIKSEKEYLVFEGGEQSLSLMKGKKVLDLIRKKYDYDGWAEEVGEEEASIENFLLWYAEEANNEEEFYLAVFEKN